MRYPFPYRARAFTLVEFLILVAMLAVAGGLLVVGLQKSNESARRIQCTNNLKQIGITVHAYADVYKRVPPAWNPDGTATPHGKDPETFSYTSGLFCSPPQTGLSAGPRAIGSIFFIMLPYVESSSFYRDSQTAAGQFWSMNPSTVDSMTGEKISVPATVLPLYLCPADSSNDGNLTSFALASCNYAANIMVFDPYATGQIWQSMPDGPNNTIMFAERYKKGPLSGSSFAEPAWALYPAADSWNPYYDVPVFGWAEYAAYEAFSGPRTKKRFSGTNCSTAGVMASEASPGTVGFQIAPASADCDPTVTQGPHPGSIQVLLGDGSVRGISALVSAETWIHLCVPNDGKPLEWL
jgi:type II secretory pathway pseudopilin PulG